MRPRLLWLILKADNRNVLSLYLDVERALLCPRPGTVCYDSLGVADDVEALSSIAFRVIADVDVSGDFAVSIQLMQN